MKKEHNILISRHRAIALSIVGYLGLLIPIALLILAFITQGTIQLTTILCLTAIFIMFFIFKNPKKLNLFDKIKIEK